MGGGQEYVGRSGLCLGVLSTLCAGVIPSFRTSDVGLVVELHSALAGSLRLTLHPSGVWSLEIAEIGGEWLPLGSGAITEEVLAFARTRATSPLRASQGEPLMPLPPQAFGVEHPDLVCACIVKILREEGKPMRPREILGRLYEFPDVVFVPRSEKQGVDTFDESALTAFLTKLEEHDLVERTGAGYWRAGSRSPRCSR